ncbi:MAG TPA: hypothetical protein PLL33_10370 [Paracoccus sp. (in: a-proteobacteria)]|nr:hypothetical protein [Paracoccus sp. (in: a-proteobacteria)]
MIRFPVQSCVIFGAIRYATHLIHPGGRERTGLFFGIGVMSGMIGMDLIRQYRSQR